MKRFLSAMLCAVITAAVITGCSSEKESEASSRSAQSSAPAPSTAPTQPKIATVDDASASPDSAELSEGDVSYNSLSIKKNINEIEANLDSIVEALGFSGAAYMKIGNDFEYVKTKGFANQGAHIDNSIYRGCYAGSVTKLFTATAVMKLAEENKLSLDDTLDKYFKGCVYGKEVTVRQLLAMTSGIPNYVSRDKKIVTLNKDLQGKLNGGSAYEKNKATILSWILSQPLQKEKYGKFDFSDSNYYLLGEIIGSVSGEQYEAYMSEAVFKPSFMTKTGFEPDESTASPYESKKETAPLLYEGVGYSALGVITNVSDMLKFVDALTANQIIGKESAREMLTDGGDGFGYGVFINGSRYSCEDRIDAYSAKLSFTSDKSLIFAAVSNYSDSDPDKLQAQARNYLVKYRN